MLFYERTAHYSTKDSRALPHTSALFLVSSLCNQSAQFAELPGKVALHDLVLTNDIGCSTRRPEITHKCNGEGLHMGGVTSGANRGLRKSLNSRLVPTDFRFPASPSK